MSVEALWIARYGDANMQAIFPGLSNAGVVVLESGKLFGGDALYYYTGTYELKGDKLTAKARITHYNGPVQNAFGTTKRDFEIIVEVATQGDSTMSGWIAQVENPGLQLPVLLEKKAPLP